MALADQIAVPDGGVLRHVGLSHPGGSIGYRIDWPGKSLAMITDTTADGSYVDFVRGVDLLIHECYLSDSSGEWAKKTGHSHTTPVAELARNCGAGQLLLIHIDPRFADADPIDLKKARGIFPRTELAEDLMVVEF